MGKDSTIGQFDDDTEMQQNLTDADLIPLDEPLAGEPKVIKFKEYFPRLRPAVGELAQSLAAHNIGLLTNQGKLVEMKRGTVGQELIPEVTTEIDRVRRVLDGTYDIDF